MRWLGGTVPAHPGKSCGAGHINGKAAIGSPRPIDIDTQRRRRMPGCRPIAEPEWAEVCELYEFLGAQLAPVQFKGSGIRGFKAKGEPPLVCVDVIGEANVGGGERDLEVRHVPPQLCLLGKEALSSGRGRIGGRSCLEVVASRGQGQDEEPNPGNPEQCANVLQQYIDIGCHSFCLSGYLHDAEAERFHRMVRPILMDRNRGRMKAA